MEAVHPSGGCLAKVRMTLRMPPGDSHGPTWITCGMHHAMRKLDMSTPMDGKG